VTQIFHIFTFQFTATWNIFGKIEAFAKDSCRSNDY